MTTRAILDVCSIFGRWHRCSKSQITHWRRGVTNVDKAVDVINALRWGQSHCGISILVTLHSEDLLGAMNSPSQQQVDSVQGQPTPRPVEAERTPSRQCVISHVWLTPLLIQLQNNPDLTPRHPSAEPAGSPEVIYNSHSNEATGPMQMHRSPGSSSSTFQGYPSIHTRRSAEKSGDGSRSFSPNWST